jgi:hypothetical protein
VLKDLLSPQSEKKLELKLGYERAEVTTILSHIIGDGVPRLPTLGVPEYSMFGPRTNFLEVKADNMRTVGELMEASPPLPMTPLIASDAFCSIKEAGAQLSHSAEIQHREAAESLRL